MLSRRQLCAITAAAIPAAAVDLPRPAKPFTFRLPGGKSASLADAKGKVVALTFVNFT
jgi:cytochrome oxidase Cu insertion factor (SCO1/SenC/PrrC family)